MVYTTSDESANMVDLISMSLNDLNDDDIGETLSLWNRSDGKRSRKSFPSSIALMSDLLISGFAASPLPRLMSAVLVVPASKESVVSNLMCEIIFDKSASSLLSNLWVSCSWHVRCLRWSMQIGCAFLLNRNTALSWRANPMIPELLLFVDGNEVSIGKTTDLCRFNSRYCVKNGPQMISALPVGLLPTHSQAVTLFLHSSGSGRKLFCVNKAKWPLKSWHC